MVILPQGLTESGVPAVYHTKNAPNQQVRFFTAKS